MAIKPIEFAPQEVAVGSKGRKGGGKFGQKLGMTAGAVIGGAIGGTAGSIVPGAGTALGVAAGSAMGATAGAGLGSMLGEMVRPGRADTSAIERRAQGPIANFVHSDTSEQLKDSLLALKQAPQEVRYEYGKPLMAGYLASLSRDNGGAA